MKSSTPQPLIVAPPQNMPAWRLKMEDWIEGDSDEPFIKEGLALSLDEVTAIKSDIKKAGGLECSVSCTTIKIIRVN